MKTSQDTLKSPQQLAYGISDALAIVPIGRSMLYEEIRSGRLRAFCIGKRRLIAATDLKAWLDSYKRQGE